MTYSDLQQMLSFAVFIITSLWNTIMQYNILQIPIVGFMICIILWIIMHLIPSDIFGWHSKIARGESESHKYSRERRERGDKP